MPTVKPPCTECQKERRQFLRDGNKKSPGCAELWRLAFAQDMDAWNCIKIIFEPWITRLCDASIYSSSKISGLSRQDVPDIAQDVWHNLWRYAVRNPTDALGLLAEDDISRVIGLIKTTVKHRVVELCRKPHGYEDVLPDDDPLTGVDRESVKSQPPKVDPPEVEGVLDILAFLQRHIKTAQEKIIAEVIFLQEMKPLDVFDLHPGKFANVEEVNQVRQTLIRRLRNDPASRKFDSSASLQFKLENDEVPMQEKPNLFDPCPYDEGVLLDYINGHVTVAIRAAIERSPACVQAAADLKAELAMWQPALRQMFCPTSEKLVAYQEKNLPANQQLVVAAHIRQCPVCLEELQMLDAIDAVPSEPQPSLPRRLYKLIFQPATLAPVPVRGEGSYRTIERTPQIELLIRTTRTTGKQGNWMLFGRVRYEGDQPMTQVESIVMQDVEEEDAPEFSTTVDEQGAFTVKGLDAGLYRIRILTAAEEIILREFRVGETY